MTWGELLTVWTIRLSLVLMAIRWLTGWSPAKRQPPRLARLAWSLGFLLFLMHLGFAFHFFHDWNHAAAVQHTAERTRQQLGWTFGPGIYFNYLFGIVWGLDTLWSWMGPESYCRRARALSAATHGLLMFIAFQSAVVFASGPTRWIAAGVTAAIAVRWALIQDR